MSKHILFSQISLAESEEEMSVALELSRWWEAVDGLTLKATLANKAVFIDLALEHEVAVRKAAMIQSFMDGLRCYDVSGQIDK